MVVFNEYAKRVAVLGKKKAAMIASDEYIDKEGKIRCRVCHGARRAPSRLNNEIIQMCCSCSCKKKEKQIKEKKKYEEAVQKNRKKIITSNFIRYKDSSIKTDDKLNTNVSTIIQKYVENFDNMFAAGKGLVFYGGAGTGKTFAMVAILNEVAKLYKPNTKKLYSCYINNFSGISQELQSCFNSQFNSTIEDYYNSLNKYDLIAIDDWGRERSTPFMNDVIVNIICKRYDCKKPLLLTTNLDMRDINNFADLSMGRTYSRLCETCYMVCVNGGDRRKYNASTRYIH